MRKWHINIDKQTKFHVAIAISLEKLMEKLDTHIVIKHFKVNFSGAQQKDLYECNESAEGRNPGKSCV